MSTHGHLPFKKVYAVEFAGVVKWFGSVPVLDNFDFNVMPGEKVAIIGRSGSGKTTILRLLMGLERPAAGSIWSNGECVWDEPAALNMKQVRIATQHIGFVFQHFNLFPHMTAIDNVASGPMYAKRLDRRAATEKSMELLRQVGLEDKAHSYPGQLSGGQQQRVAIARALACDPKILLFDEPTSALDPELVAEVLNVIESLAADSDVTLLIVTHEMNFARRIANRVVFCHQGRIIEDGKPEDVLDKPSHQQTRAFIRAVLRNGDG